MFRDIRAAALAAPLLLAFVHLPAAAAPPSQVVTSGCEEEEVSVPVPAAEMRKLLPPGFKLAKLDPTGVLAGVDISFDHCDSVDGGDGSDDFLAFVEVVPPTQYTQPGIDIYGLLLKLWSDRKATVDTFTDWGFGEQSSVGDIVSGKGLNLAGRSIASVSADSENTKLTARFVMTARKSLSPAGSTRGFAVDGAGQLHILDASWTDQTFQFGVGTLVQLGKNGPLPWGFQPSPALVGHATDYALTLRWVQ